MDHMLRCEAREGKVDYAAGWDTPKSVPAQPPCPVSLPGRALPRLQPELRDIGLQRLCFLRKKQDLSASEQEFPGAIIQDGDHRKVCLRKILRDLVTHVVQDRA